MESGKKLRIGVIGGVSGRGSGWVRKMVEWKESLFPNLELVAICDKNPAVKQKAAKMQGVEAFLDYKEMYKKANLDVVIIATPHYLHAPMAIAAAEADIHVFTEKPMCITLRQADAMARAVKMNGVMLAVGFQRRFANTHVLLKNLIDSGDLGFVYQLNLFARSFRTNMYYDTSTLVIDPKTGREHGWKGHWNTEGGGALANQLIHHMDIYQWIAPSPIKSVCAISRIARHTFTETDDNTNVIVEFMDGSMGNIQAGVAYEFGRDTEFGIYGTKGTVIHRGNMRDEEGKPLPIIDLRQDKSKPLKKYSPGLLMGETQMFGDFLEAIEEDDPSLISVDVDEGRKSIELLRGIFMSIILEKKVTFPLHDAEIWPSLARTYKDPTFSL
ncbi:MAG: Gfo/Idh/MocA family protein [Candidatus Hodarchaeota archaeon]